ncbi:hypothetical protein PIB30_059894 [Stylosanthes scabra]|uniref:Uncharacterized protein n=1 Tax=Stylosanthes scabra TaxID=79078 RepID=A0ABU6XLY8_9FABA|nr:hypothetical protein [Stylosanthes scabra]
MTTNISECINVVFKGTWFLPISVIVRATNERLQQLSVQKRREAHDQLVAGAAWSQRLLAANEESHASHQFMRVIYCDRRNSVFLVEDGISLPVPPCDYCFCIERFRVGAYVDLVFTVTNLFKVYEMEFPPIPDENLWPEWMGSRLHPNSQMKRKAKV